MKPVCCDTSFLFAAYAADVYTHRAVRVIHSLQQPITVSLLNLFELENAFRFARSRSLISPDQLGFLLASLESDCRRGRIHQAPVDLMPVVAEARRLSALHTCAGGYRSFDILLVAGAVHLEARLFLSFDSRQRRLAKAAGLELNP